MLNNIANVTVVAFAVLYKIWTKNVQRKKSKYLLNDTKIVTINYLTSSV